MTFGYFSKIDCSNLGHLSKTVQLAVYLITVFVTSTTEVNKYTLLIRKQSRKNRTQDNKLELAYFIRVV